MSTFAGEGAGFIPDNAERDRGNKTIQTRM